jgi:hypothetical protein
VASPSTRTDPPRLKRLAPICPLLAGDETKKRCVRDNAAIFQPDTADQGNGRRVQSPIPDYSACEIKYFAYVGDSKMKTICGRILVAMALLGALAGCASMIGEGVSVNPTSPPVYGAYADE